MKPEAAPHVSGATPWARLDNAFRSVLKVPKEALLREEAKQKRQRERKRKRP